MPPKGTKRVLTVLKLFAADVDGGRVILTNDNVNRVKLPGSVVEARIESGHLAESWVPKDEAPPTTTDKE